MKVLVADKLEDSIVDNLKAQGADVRMEPGLKDDALVEALASFRPQVLVVRSTKVPENALSACSELELVVRAGAGYDTIDVSAASSRGIFVSNCPGKNATAVAELTMGLILSLDRSIPDNVADARAGKWNKALYSQAAGLKGRTLGLVGLGNIGSEVAALARSFGMDVIAWSRSLNSARAAALGVRMMDGPEQVAANADIVSLHVAATSDTQNLADKGFFDAMKPGAWLINTTRSSVVDEDALLSAIATKGIRAAVDVFDGEPAGKEGEMESALAHSDAVYITHHIGASTQQAQEAIAAEALRIISTYMIDGFALNCVNMAAQTPVSFQLTVRHLDKVGVLAKILHEISESDWNVQEMENLVFDGARAACAQIRIDGAEDETTIARIQNIPDVIAVKAIRM